MRQFQNTLNRCLAEKSFWQMPDTDSIFAEIGKGNTYMASLDVKSGYWHCRITPEDRYKTCFQWANRSYQFVRLPMGLTMAGDIFSAAYLKLSNPSEIRTAIRYI